jgi:flagella basal body P-ring formation protein FlgA
VILALLLAAATGVASVPTPATQTLPADTITAAVTQRVQARLQQMGSTATFAFAGRIGDQTLPSGHADVRVDMDAGPFPRARVGVPVWLWVDGRPVRPITVWIAMHDEREVPVYTKPYAAKTPASALQLRTRRIDMTCCTGMPIESDARIDGLRLRVPARTDMPALAGDFEPLPAVTANAPVKIDVDRGVVHLTVAGTALADGRIGDTVAVRIDQGRQALRARVIGPQQVQIDE